MCRRTVLSCLVTLLLMTGLALQAGCIPFDWPLIAGATDVPDDPNDPNDPNVVSDPNDPNGTDDPNLADDPNDPNTTDDANQPMPSLAGTWEVSETDDRTSGWDDPEAPLAAFFEAQGNPFNNFGSLADGRRSFVVFDENPTLIASYQVDEEADIIYVEVNENPFLGTTMEADPNGLYRFPETVMMDGPMGGGLSARMTVQVFAQPEDETAQTWTITMDNVVALTAENDIPANPDAGTDAVSAGEQAVFRSHWVERLTPTDSVYELFPNAAWEILPSEHEASMAIPTGYFEITGPQSCQTGWQDPSSSLAQFIDEQEHSPVSDGPTIVDEGSRVFAHFDENGAMGLTFDYETATNRLSVSAQNPFLGQIPTRQDNKWTWTGQFTWQSSEVSYDMQSEFNVYDGDAAQGRYMQMQQTLVATALTDIAENPETGRPAVSAGATATWQSFETYVATSSESPYVLFPNAELDFGGGGEGEEGGGE